MRVRVRVRVRVRARVNLAILGRVAEHRLQVLHVVVCERLHLAARAAHALDDRFVVEGVAQHLVRVGVRARVRVRVGVGVRIRVRAGVRVRVRVKARVGSLSTSTPLPLPDGSTSTGMSVELVAKPMPTTRASSLSRNLATAAW